MAHCASLTKFSLEIERGRKIAFVGPNGAGKIDPHAPSSPMWTRVMKVPFRWETDVEIGYFAQDSAEKMASERTVEEEAENRLPQ